MTFAELAAVRRTTKRAAVTLIRRHGWRRQRDNQGHVIALVPLTWAIPAEATAANGEAHSEPHREGQGASHSEPAAEFDAALAAIREAHAGEIAALLSTAT
jgi:hypothetical protein